MSDTPHIPEQTEERLSWLYENYARKLCGFAIKNYQVNEDIAWEITYKTIYKINAVITNYQFEHPGKLNAFIFRTFINYLKNYFRDRKEVPVSFTTEIPSVSNEEESADSHLITVLRDELDKMQDWERILLLMRSQDLPYSQIAEFTGKPEKQLKVYYARLKDRLEKKLRIRLKNMNSI